MVLSRNILSKRKNRKQKNRKLSSKRQKKRRVLTRMRKLRKNRLSRKLGGGDQKPEKRMMTSMVGERRTDLGVTECHRHSPGCVKGKKIVGWDIDLWDCDPNRVPGDPDADCKSPGPDPSDPKTKLYDLKGKKVSKWTPPELGLSPGETETPFCCPYQASEILTEKGGFCRSQPCDAYLPIEK